MIRPMRVFYLSLKERRVAIDNLANYMSRRTSHGSMNATTGGQLCARARFWASLRVDDELSELEGALLDAHLARCAECREFEAAAAGSATLLRAAPLEAVPQVVLPS